MTDKGHVEYPLDAKRAGLTGSGVAMLEVDSTTGAVKAVTMAVSTGHQILDQAVIKGLKAARFRKGTVPVVKIPVTFTFGGFQTYYDVKKKDMDDVLARFLGKGTVLKGPIPAYPRGVPWVNKSGKGVYELHSDRNGKVLEVRVLKPSGDPVFDGEALKTLKKWRLRPRAKNLILELPLRFTLTPSSYSVDVGR